MIEWEPIETIPEEGVFLVYMPEETKRKYQIFYKNNNVNIIGNAFAFDLTKPTKWAYFNKVEQNER